MTREERINKLAKIWVEQADLGILSAHFLESQVKYLETLDGVALLKVYDEEFKK